MLLLLLLAVMRLHPRENLLYATSHHLSINMYQTLRHLQTRIGVPNLQKTTRRFTTALPRDLWVFRSIIFPNLFRNTFQGIIFAGYSVLQCSKNVADLQ